MNPLRLTLAAALAVWGFQAIAQDAPKVQDTDGNGSYSLQEIQAAYPSVTEDDYNQMDTDHDGTVSPDELAAAAEGGMLPPKS